MITRLISAALDLPIKHDSLTGTVTVKDYIYKQNRFVEYSLEECRIIKENITEIDRSVHKVKKIFDGEIVNKKYTSPVKTDTGVIEPTQIDLF